MILWFTALDKHVQFRNFSCQLTDFDVALDVLCTITAQGSKLLTARIIDEGNHLELSVNAFDGEPLTGPIRQLKEQWQAILSEPVRSLR